MLSSWPTANYCFGNDLNEIIYQKMTILYKDSLFNKVLKRAILIKQGIDNSAYSYLNVLLKMILGIKYKTCF